MNKEENRVSRIEVHVEECKGVEQTNTSKNPQSLMTSMTSFESESGERANFNSNRSDGGSDSDNSFSDDRSGGSSGTNSNDRDNSGSGKRSNSNDESRDSATSPKSDSTIDGQGLYSGAANCIPIAVQVLQAPPNLTKTDQCHHSAKEQLLLRIYENQLKLEQSKQEYVKQEKMKQEVAKHEFDQSRTNDMIHHLESAQNEPISLSRFPQSNSFVNGMRLVNQNYGSGQNTSMGSHQLERVGQEPNFALGVTKPSLHYGSSSDVSINPLAMSHRSQQYSTLPQMFPTQQSKFPVQKNVAPFISAAVYPVSYQSQAPAVLPSKMHYAQQQVDHGNMFRNTHASFSAPFYPNPTPPGFMPPNQWHNVYHASQAPGSIPNIACDFQYPNVNSTANQSAAQFNPGSNYSSNQFASFPQYNRNGGHYVSPQNGGNLQLKSQFLGPKVGMQFQSVLDSNPFEEKDFLESVRTGVNFDKYDDIPVSVTGSNVAAPFTSFSELLLPPTLMKCIELSGYVKPTPIQKYSLPISLSARDLMACAQTGSGKTAAFLIPIVAMLLVNGVKEAPIDPNNPRYRKYAPNALILAPTRELSTQIFESARRLTWGTKLRPVVIFGGCDIKLQFGELNRGCDILIGTPGRLIDLLSRGRMTMENVFYLVFDEADNMCDMGFEPQIRQIIELYGMPDSTLRQTVMFSATFPKEIQKLASDFLLDHVFLNIGRVGSTTENISQHIMWVEEQEKFPQLVNFLKCCNGLVLLFVETRKSADILEQSLRRQGFALNAIHGERTQLERESAISNFRHGRIKILVATDVASRGLDIPNVMNVINYDLPTNIESYVHRIGRTGRCGNRGNAYSFINTKNSMIFKDLANLLVESNCEVPSFLLDKIKKNRMQGNAQAENEKPLTDNTAQIQRHESINLHQLSAQLDANLLFPSDLSTSHMK